MNKEAVELMKKEWGSKHELMTDIVHIIKAIASDKHDTEMCIFCYKSDHGCHKYSGSCPVAIFFDKSCTGFRVFGLYYYADNRDTAIVTAILNKLRRMLLKASELEDWG